MDGIENSVVGGIHKKEKYDQNKKVKYDQEYIQYTPIDSHQKWIPFLTLNHIHTIQIEHQTSWQQGYLDLIIYKSQD